MLKETESEITRRNKMSIELMHKDVRYAFNTRYTH